MRIIILFIISFGYLGLLDAELDTQALFDVNEKCNYGALDLTSVSDNSINTSMNGVMGVVTGTPSNTVSGYNIDGQVY